MSITVKKSQFIADPATPGNLIVPGHIAPTDDLQAAKGILPGSAGYSVDNGAAATVAPDPADQTKFNITWVGAGKVTVASRAQSDPSGNTLTDFLDLELVDDLTPPPPPPATEATKLNMQLDLPSA